MKETMLKGIVKGQMMVASGVAKVANTFANRNGAAEEEGMSTAGKILVTLAVIAVIFMVVMFSIGIVNKSKGKADGLFNNLFGQVDSMSASSPSQVK
ncbi:MAG: hypothetical protein E7H54_04550 [Clostridium perfringens]|uniref:hypothetical protein n=1 Tax=Clostridium perfringens TaxID=1502 RepID=UPI0024BCCDA6|nr:hypothetical protein [Clostridium perfringens]MDU8988429.1 hypothetical protein [Clostridium perfringens]